MTGFALFTWYNWLFDMVCKQPYHKLYTAKLSFDSGKKSLSQLFFKTWDGFVCYTTLFQVPGIQNDDNKHIQLLGLLLDYVPHASRLIERKHTKGITLKLYITLWNESVTATAFQSSTLHQLLFLQKSSLVLQLHADVHGSFFLCNYSCSFFTVWYTCMWSFLSRFYFPTALQCSLLTAILFHGLPWATGTRCSLSNG